MELDRTRNKLRGIEEQVEAVAEHLTKIPKGLDPTLIYSQMQRLNAMKEECERSWMR